MSTKTNVQKALENEWKLGYPVKIGQVIPAGTRHLCKDSKFIFDNTFDAPFLVSDEIDEENIRTLVPLQEPEPEWMDAPAVIAVCNDNMDPEVFVLHGDNWWVSKNYAAGTHDLRKVTPLWPEGSNR